MKTSTQKSATPGTNGPEAPRVPHFDKLRTMKSLQAATFSEDQVEAIDDAQRYLATKSDMLAMKSDIQTSMEMMEARILTSMEKMERRLRADMEKREAGIRVDMHAELKKLYWYIPVVVGVVASLLGAAMRL